MSLADPAALERAMARMLDQLDAAERRGQPERLLDRLEVAYLAALAAYARARGRPEGSTP